MLAVFLLAGVAAPASAQAVSEVTLEASPQLFTALCALRATGLMPAGASADSRAVLAPVDAALARLPPETLAPLRAFFEQNRPTSSAGTASAYISVALVLQPPPDLELSLTREQLPPDVWELEGVQPLLRTFHQQADLERLWQQVRPRYESAIAARQPEVSRMLLETRTYLRLIGESYPGRTYTVYLEWLVPPTLTSARNYGEHYYLVVHPQHPDLGDAVRHQYLHFLLDPIAAKYAGQLGPWVRLQAEAERAPRLPAAFRNDLLLLTTESLIQAVELRLRRLAPAATAAALDAAESNGYIFTRHFYYSLGIFEQEEPSIRYYFPELVRSLDVAQEQARLARVEFAPRGPEEDRSPAPPDTTRRLLAEADTFLAAGNYPAARERFERILEMNPNEPAALYGLALLASLAQDREQAKQYFLRALENGREPHLLGWTHVYLGRIYDLEGARQQAVEHYQAALALHSGLEGVEQAARRGLERPFAGKEEPVRPPKL